MYPLTERLPRVVRAEFIAEPGPYGRVVHLTLNGAEVGDPLTDRGWWETGYRWHDALLDLWHHQGGTLTGDMETARMEFHPPAAIAS